MGYYSKESLQRVVDCLKHGELTLREIAERVNLHLASISVMVRKETDIFERIPGIHPLKIKLKTVSEPPDVNNFLSSLIDGLNEREVLKRRVRELEQENSQLKLQVGDYTKMSAQIIQLQALLAQRD